MLLHHLAEVFNFIHETGTFNDPTSMSLLSKLDHDATDESEGDIQMPGITLSSPPSASIRKSNFTANNQSTTWCTDHVQRTFTARPNIEPPGSSSYRQRGKCTGSKFQSRTVLWWGTQCWKRRRREDADATGNEGG